MGIFKNPIAEWENTMTENDLDKMEAQGLDVSAYREKLAARRAREEEQAKQDRERYQNPTDLSKLEPYVRTPRSTDTPFFRRTAGKQPLLFKSKWLRKYTEGQIILVGIVDAPAEAWKGVKHEDSTHEVIGVYALDEAHVRDAGWVKKVTAALRGMHEGKQPVAAECKDIMDMIADESEWSPVLLTGSLAEGADAYVRRLVVEDKELPKGYLPTDGIVPHFYWEGTISCLHAELYA